MRVGDWVVAVGSPFGLETTVTAGVLSATGRAGLGMNPIEDYLQTDASINPGNSGGPLVNLAGEVIGINTMIVGQGTGIGFAIPADMAKSAADQLIASGRVERAWIGVGVQDLSPSLARSFGVGPNDGAVVSQIVPGSPAERAGLQVGDVVVSAGDREIHASQDVVRAVLAGRPGTTLALRVRRGGRELSQTVALGVRPGENEQVASRGEARRPSAQATGGLGLQLEQTPNGKVTVFGVQPGGPADRAGLSRGDVIMEIDRRPVRDAADAAARLRANPRALLRIERRDEALFVALG
jgi:S1-C subfamily serine protease